MCRTAVVDNAQCTVLKLHHDDGGVHVIILVIACTGQCCAICGNLGYLAACQVAYHIKIMNGHIHEDTAGNLDVIHGLMIRVTGGYLDDVGCTQLTGSYGITNCLVVVVKAADKAYLQLDASLFHCVQCFSDLVQLGINRLLAEDMLASLCSTNDKLCMGVGRGADKDSFNGRIRENHLRIIIALLNAHLSSPCPGCIIHKGICYRIQLCCRNRMCQIFTVQLADTSCTQQTNSYFFHRKSPSFSKNVRFFLLLSSFCLCFYYTGIQENVLLYSCAKKPPNPVKIPAFPKNSFRFLLFPFCLFLHPNAVKHAQNRTISSSCCTKNAIFSCSCCMCACTQANKTQRNIFLFFLIFPKKFARLYKTVVGIYRIMNPQERR